MGKTWPGEEDNTPSWELNITSLKPKQRVEKIKSGVRLRFINLLFTEKD